MKKILTVLVVVLLATTTIFAVDFSRRFRAGYKFSFGDDFTASAWKNPELKLTAKISDDAGIWTVNVKALNVESSSFTLDKDALADLFTGNVTSPEEMADALGNAFEVSGGKVSLDSDDKLSANLSLNIAALLAANNVDLGDVSLALSIGSNGAMTALSAYNDVTGDSGYKFKNDGAYSTELAIGYGDLIQTKIAIDPNTAGKVAVALSALTKPVDGVAVSAVYGHNAIVYTMGSDDVGVSMKNAFGAAADFNIAALAGLDFDLGVTVYDNFAWEKDASYNALAAAVYGGVDFIDAYFELRMDNATVTKNTESNFGMKTQVNFNVVENLGLDVYLSASDFEAFDTTFKVGGDVSYTLSGVEFAANLEYAAADEEFSITPKVIVVF